jgi:hypothetical protein
MEVKVIYYQIVLIGHLLICLGIIVMEIYSVEIDIGQLTIEVSIQHITPRIRFNTCYESNKLEEGFNVYLTARGKDLRRIWRTPIIDETGVVKRYYSIEDAMTDVNGRLKEKQIPF